MDREPPEAPALFTPDQEVEAARAALARGDVTAAGAHLARALAHDVGRREWLIFLDEVVKAGELDPDRIAPLGEQPYFAALAVRAYVLARRRDVTAAILLLLRAFAMEPQVPFLRWGASWLSAPGVAAKVDVDAILGSLLQALQRFPGDDLDEAQREALDETTPLLDQLEEAHAGSWRLSWVQSIILRKILCHAEASVAAERAFAAAPSYDTALALACARREEGQIAAARAAFEAAIQLDPDNEEARADLARLPSSD
jgi:tetratricopeptide (TPR) repeat protein